MNSTDSIVYVNFCFVLKRLFILHVRLVYFYIRYTHNIDASIQAWQSTNLAYTNTGIIISPRRMRERGGRALEYIQTTPTTRR